MPKTSNIINGKPCNAVQANLDLRKSQFFLSKIQQYFDLKSTYVLNLKIEIKKKSYITGEFASLDHS